MKRRDFLKAISAGLASLAMPGCGEATKPVSTTGSAKKKPNFVFIIIDDLGWKDVGFISYASGFPEPGGYYETPNIDRLASEGVVFTNAYANAPNCAPTRACLMSGQYTPRHGVYTVDTSERGPANLRKLTPIPNNPNLNSKIVTIPEALKPAGYVSACIGKWHLGSKSPHQPQEQGFDVAVDRTHPGHFSPQGQYLTDRLTDEAIKFIEANKDKPFFLYLSHHAVHTPIQAKKEIIEKYKKKQPSGGHNNPTYAAMIESMDQSVGRVMDKLDELRLTENTVTFFFSDNGGVGGYRELGIKDLEITSNAPLRGGKGMLYEGGIRVPLTIRWPGQAGANSVCDVPVVGIDFYPTILEIAGVQKPAEQILDGKSIIPLLKGEGSFKRDEIFWHFPAYLQGSKGTWRTTPAGAVRQGDWKLIEFFEDGRGELYNLKDDISEKTNLAEKMPNKTELLHQVLVNWRRNIAAPVPTEKNPQYAPVL